MKHIQIFFCLLLVPLIVSAQEADSTIIERSTTFSLFTDLKSADVGDIVTVHIIEYSSGSNQATTNIKNKDKRKFDMGGNGAMAASLAPMGFEFGKQGEFKGEGKTIQKGDLRAKITARIVERLPNNNLRIEGKREVNMNKDRQVITLKGVVRPQDILANNVIYSYNLADAKITYTGKGAINQGQRPGCIFKMINWFF